MSEIRIINQIIHQSVAHKVKSAITEDLVKSLRVGEILNAKLVYSENKHWLVLENIKIFIPSETVEQWNFQEKQTIKLRVNSLKEPIELQIVNNKTTVKEPPKVPLNESAKTQSTLIANEAEKLILEVRKYINKPDILLAKADVIKATESLPAIKPEQTTIRNAENLKNTVNIESPTIQNKQTIQSNSTAHINEKLVVDNIQHKAAAGKTTADNISQQIQRVISNSKSYITEQQNKTSITTDRNLTLNTDTPKTDISVKQSLLKAEVVNTDITKASVIPKQTDDANKNIINNKIVNQPPIAQTNQTAKLNVATEDKPQQLNSKQQQQIKFEVPALLPDKDRFPLLAEKINTAYERHMRNHSSAEKSFNKLYQQLSRLNQWSADNRATRHSENGVQTEKIVSKLKHSLNDLFRYVPHKSEITSPHNIEKSIKQSGVFLEKRIVQEQKHQQLPQSGQDMKLSPGLTLHKDLKANLNRVLTTALYNLAKLTSLQTAPANPTATSTVATTKAATAIHKQALEQSLIHKSNLINNVRNKLSQITTTNTSSTNLNELELITKAVLKNTQSALSNIHLTQLSNLRPETAPQQWLFELPILNNKELDMVSIFLKQHEEKEKVLALQKKWSLVMQFDIANLGKLRAKLVWENNKVNINFLAEQSNTVSLVDSELSHFKEKLSKMGLSFENLSIEEAKLDDLSFQFSKADSKTASKTKYTRANHE